MGDPVEFVISKFDCSYKVTEYTVLGDQDWIKVIVGHRNFLFADPNKFHCFILLNLCLKDPFLTKLLHFKLIFSKALFTLTSLLYD